MYQTIFANGGAPSLVVPQKMGARTMELWLGQISRRRGRPPGKTHEEFGGSLVSVLVFTAVCPSAQVIPAPIPSCLPPTFPTSVSSIRALGNSLSAFWDKP